MRSTITCLAATAWSAILLSLAPIAPAEEKSPVRMLLKQIAEKEQPHFGAAVLRELVNLGPAAVPELIDELDTTQDERMMRSLGFVLRAIGDKRAVPSLIRALPKTCLPPSSDYGDRVEDADLMAFMRKYDLEEGNDDADHFGFGRPVLEIGGALQKLTGQKQNEQELCFVFLNGSDHQQRQQRKLYQRTAEQWTAWWQSHWKDQGVDEAYSKVNLYVRKDLENSRAFPHGPNVKFAEPMSGMILQSVQTPATEAIAPFGTLVFLDLDTNRIGSLPKRLRPSEGQAEKTDEIAAWAAQEGFDVMGTEYTVPGEDKPHYVVRSLGLTAWRVKTELWVAVEKELAGPNPPALDSPAGGLLARYDEAKAEYVPQEFATFLFITREGGYGALFIGAEATDTRIKPGTPALPSHEEERSPLGFAKGRKLSYRLIEDPTK
jgi:hypothetical protein